MRNNIHKGEGSLVFVFFRGNYEIFGVLYNSTHQLTPKQKRLQIPISYELSERLVEANNHKSGVLTLVDRRSRFLFAVKLLHESKGLLREYFM